MIIRDPVHGLISFEGKAERWVGKLLEVPELQRLRRIRQLGLTSMVFPGAEHSRFSHAIGTAHVMNRLQKRLLLIEQDVPRSLRLTDEDKQEAVAASLFHDLGHGAFSHLFEALLPRADGHEGWTQQLLRDPSTDAYQALESIRSGLAERVADLLKGKARLGYLARAVSGTLDVDRCDYLLRDSLMTGVRYGFYDLEWLQQVLVLREVPGLGWGLAVDGERGLPPVEGFFIGRHHMHQQVYHHRGTRAAERLVHAAFSRMCLIVANGSSLNPLPAALAAVARNQSVSLSNYLEVDDAVLQTCIASWQNCGDPVLSEMSRRIHQRALFKSITLPEDPAVQQEALNRSRELVGAHPWGPEWATFLDTSGDTPYMEGEEGAAGVWVSLRQGKLIPLSDASFVLQQLANKRRSKCRLMFLPENRDRVWQAVGPLLD